MNNINYDVPTLYAFNDKLLFRKCSLADSDKPNPGDCTNYSNVERHFQFLCSCKQKGIHFHCAKHHEVELTEEGYGGVFTLTCPKCKQTLYSGDRDELVNACLRMLNEPKFQKAKLVRIEDWYYPQISQDVPEIKQGTSYWMHVDVKEDMDGDTIVVLYVGNKGSKDKSQFFIKPEKMQLTNDYKDLDPATILAKIEVTFKNKDITEKFK